MRVIVFKMLIAFDKDSFKQLPATRFNERELHLWQNFAISLAHQKGIEDIKKIHLDLYLIRS